MIKFNTSNIYKTFKNYQRKLLRVFFRRQRLMQI